MLLTWLYIIEMMLQKDISHTTARFLALHACSTHLEQDKDNLLSASTEGDKTVLDTEVEEFIVSISTGIYL